MTSPSIARRIRDVAAQLQPVAARVPEGAIAALEEAIGHAEAGRDDDASAALRRSVVASKCLHDWSTAATWDSPFAWESTTQERCLRCGIDRAEADRQEAS